MEISLSATKIVNRTIVRLAHGRIGQIKTGSGQVFPFVFGVIQDPE